MVHPNPGLGFSNGIFRKQRMSTRVGRMRIGILQILEEYK
jgi:hypothetical protein